MNSGINLLEKKKASIGLLHYQKLRLLRLIAVGLLFLVSTLSIILFLLISFSPLPQLKRQEEQALSTLSQYHPDIAKLYLVNERTDVINNIITKRKYLDKTIGGIQTMLPTGVKVDALSINNNTVSLSVSSGSLELLDIFINSLLNSVQEKKDFSKVTLTSLSVDNQKDLFLITVSLVTL